MKTKPEPTMIKFKQTATTPEPRPVAASAPAKLPVAAEAAEPSGAKRKPAAPESKRSETQLSVAFDETLPNKG